MRKPKLTDCQISEIFRRYQSGESLKKLSKDFRVTPLGIRYHLERRGIAIRHQQKLKLNDKAFDTLTEESRYWIGFLMADGSIKNRNYSYAVDLTLLIKDIAHIELFKAFLNSGHKIRYSRHQPFAASISVTSKNLVIALEKFGIVAKKSKTAKVIGLEHDRHFWRGVVDGDGYIGRARGQYPRLELVGSYSLMQQYVSYIKSLIPESCVTVRPHKSIYRVAMTGNNAGKVISNLYSGCSIALERKQILANFLTAHL